MKNNVCVDAGGSYCPCYLSQTGDCILCAMLNEEKFCNCAWQGQCIYQNYLQNGKQIARQRESILCKLNSMNEIDEDLHILKLNVPRKLAKELMQPGAYILLKGEKNYEEKFNMPISVMNVDLEKNELTVAVKFIGPKSKILLGEKNFYVKGPYYNGIFGLKHLKTKEKKIIIISKGLSQVSLINVVKNLVKNENLVSVYIDEVSTRVQEVEAILNELNVDLNIIDIDKKIEFLKEEIKKNDIVFSASNDYMNRVIMDITDDEKPFIITNNNKICCGEGLCGACMVEIRGEKIKSCKTQIDPRLYLKEAKKWQE